MSSERAREKEVHTYYQAWLESLTAFRSTRGRAERHHRDGTTLASSSDSALIAFAQLGCLRLNAKRCTISLIASERQYVIAEATKTLSLISESTEKDRDDELWFGNASFPRSQGISEHALDSPLYTVEPASGTPSAARALVIPDITNDERFSQRAYAGDGVKFYAGVPITSARGFVIGVYTVTDDEARAGLDANQLFFLQDMTKLVMKHLEMVKNDAARFRGDKLVLALGAFLAGKMSIMEHTESAQTPSQSTSAKTKAGPHSFKGMDITNADVTILRQIHTSSTQISRETDKDTKPSSEPTGAMLDTKSAETDTHQPPINEKQNDPTASEATGSSEVDRIFTRAANLLLQCTAADGVVFFDADAANGTANKRPIHPSPKDAGTTKNEFEDDATSSSSLGETYSGHSADSDESLDKTAPQQDTAQLCPILGSAIDVSSASTADETTLAAMKLPARSLRRLIKLYPRGKAFFFGHDGQLSSGDQSSSMGSDVTEGALAQTSKTVPLNIITRSNKTISEELIRVVPGARSIFWFPLWDIPKQRWRASMFLWSRQPERLLTAQDDLRYFRTFGSSIMTELLRVDAQRADKSKATFIANISHELRSPLHGILGSLEFLQDTTMTPNQASMVHSIDTCSKTLFDTIEHVLDYSKINQPSAKFSKRKRPRSLESKHSVPSKSFLSRSCDLVDLLEDCIETIFAGQTFAARQNVLAHDSSEKEHSMTDARGEAPSPDLPLRSQDLRKGVRYESIGLAGKVWLVIDIEKRDNWSFSIQPGAFRRIVTNLVGNSLKYTERGSISVNMSRDVPSASALPDAAPNECVTLRVQDSGRGMSADFLERHAFMPFTQESSYSAGTGLGLNIVQQLVRSQSGHIDMKSQQGIGTQTTVILPGLKGQTQTATGTKGGLIPTIGQEVAGKTICLLQPAVQHAGEQRSESAVAFEAALCKLAQTWFGMRVIKSQSTEGVQTDYFIRTTSSSPMDLISTEYRQSDAVTAPTIIVASNAFESAAIVATGITDATDLGSVVEVISQPCGPKKFAQTLQRCMKRLRATTTAGPTSTSPAALQPYNEPSMSAASSEPIGQGQQEPGRLSVLLVDDNEINLKLLTAFVKKLNFHYTTARDGVEAVQLYQETVTSGTNVYDFILMDVNMPMMDGITATYRIRELEKQFGVRGRSTIIALTGLAAEDVQQSMFNAGADYYLAKPVKFQRLRDLLKLPS